MTLRKILTAGVIGLASGLLQTATAAQPEPYPLDYWAVRNQMQNVSLSPDGEHVAFMQISSKAGNPIIAIYETDDLTKAPARVSADPLEITSFRWVGSDEMVVSFRGQVSKKIDGFNQGAYRNRAALYSLETKKFRQLDSSPRTDSSAASLQYNIGIAGVLPEDPDNILVSYRALRRGESVSGAQSTDYYRYNLRTGSKRLVLKGRADKQGIQFDFNGNPRGAFYFDGGAGEFVYFYRRPNSTEWMEIYRVSQDSFETFSIEGTVPDTDNKLIYVSAHNGNDKVGMWTFDTEAKQFIDLIYRNPEVDVSGLSTHSNSWGEPSKSVAIGYYKDKFYREYFDDDVSQQEAALLEQLEGVVPNAGLVRITSRSKDGNTMVVRNVADKDPGSFYLVRNGQFQYLGGTKPLLRPENLAEVRYIQYPSRDGRMIPGFVTVPQGKPPFPLVVLPHGGPFVRETIVFDEWAQLLANNGYMVLQPQYRGSQGYGLEFYQSAFINRGEGGYSMQDDKDDGALYLVDQGLADRDRLGFFGWSYGGYAALIAASREEQIYQCSVAGAAVADNNQQFNYYKDRIEGSQRVEQLKFWEESINPIEVVDKVNIPLLIVHGSIDQRVPPKHARRYTAALDRAGVPYKYIELKDADHFSNTLFYRHKIEFFSAMIDFFENDCGPGGL